MGFEDLNQGKPSPDLQRLKDSFGRLISDLRSIGSEISGKRKKLLDTQRAEIDRIYSDQRSRDLKRESIDSDPIAHVEKFTESGAEEKSATKKEPGILLSSYDEDVEMRVRKVLSHFPKAHQAAIDSLNKAETEGRHEDANAIKEFIGEVEAELKKSEDTWKELTALRTGKFLDEIIGKGRKKDN